jgi:hypothetical protein
VDVTFIIHDAPQFPSLFEAVKLPSFLTLVVVLFHRSVPGFFVLHLNVELLELLSKIVDFLLQQFRRLLEVRSFNFVDFLDQNAALELRVVEVYTSAFLIESALTFEFSIDLLISLLLQQCTVKSSVDVLLDLLSFLLDFTGGRFSEV